MGDKTGINWTHIVDKNGETFEGSTWNYFRGCSLKSPECTNCYAMKNGGRFAGPGGPYEGLVHKVRNKWVWTGKIITVPHLLDQPLRWSRPRLIFTNSVSDWAHEDLSIEDITAFYQVMHDADWHIYQLLTKRIEAVPELLKKINLKNGRNMYRDPLAHVWQGASVGLEKTATKFLPALADTPVGEGIRWWSAEPLIGEIDYEKWVPLSKVQWIVFGGESQEGHRPLPSDANIQVGIDACRKHGVAIHFKQMGEWWARNNLPSDEVRADRTAEAWEHIPKKFRIREYPVDVAEILTNNAKRTGYVQKPKKVRLNVIL